MEIQLSFRLIPHWIRLAVDNPVSSVLNNPELLADFDVIDNIEIHAPGWTEQEIKDDEARFISLIPKGIRYTNSARLLGRIRKEGERASDDIGGEAEKPRRFTRMVGPFTGGRTSASIETNGSGEDYLVVEFFSAEQVKAGLIEEPALTFVVRDTGELIVQGPFPGGKTFNEFKKRGWTRIGNPSTKVKSNSRWNHPQSDFHPTHL